MPTNEESVPLAIGVEAQNLDVSDEGSVSERETIVNMNAGDPIVRIWTAQRHVIQRLRKDKRFTETTDPSVCADDEASFTIPRSEWTPWGGAKHRRQLTDEQRAEMSARFAKTREARG
jgi:hypothetical protein